MTSRTAHRDDDTLTTAGDTPGRLSWRGSGDSGQEALLWLPGMFDNSATGTASADDDVRQYLNDKGVALAELDYPSHLSRQPAEVARVRTAHLLSLINQAVSLLTARRPGTGVTVVGHSMGAKLALLGCLGNPVITRVVILDGWLIGAPEAAPVEPSPAVVELFGRSAHYQEMCAEIARGGQSRIAKKFYVYALGLLEQRGMLKQHAAAAANEDPEFRERLFWYLSRLDPFWSGGQKDEMIRLAQADQETLRHRYHTRGDEPLRILAINSASRNERYDEATKLTLGAMDHAATKCIKLTSRGHLDLLFGAGSGVEVGEIILDWLGASS